MTDPLSGRHSPWLDGNYLLAATADRVVTLPGVGLVRLVSASPLCVVEVPLGAPEAAVLRLDEHAVAGAPDDLRAALAEADDDAIVIVDPQCTAAQVVRAVAAAGLPDHGQLDDSGEAERPGTWRSLLAVWVALLVPGVPAGACWAV